MYGKRMDNKKFWFATVVATRILLSGKKLNRFEAVYITFTKLAQCPTVSTYIAHSCKNKPNARFLFVFCCFPILFFFACFLFVFCCFPILCFFLWVHWSCGAGVFGLIVCKSFSPMEPSISDLF